MADDDRGALAALLGLPRMGPHRIGVLVDAAGGPAAALALVRDGVPDDLPLRADATRADLVEGWRRAAATRTPDAVLAAHADAGVGVLVPGDPWWPRPLDDDPEPPLALFHLGDPRHLRRVAVAVVGTRRCSAVGHGTARAMGEGLARAGVAVTSGLALGVDGAAHRGTLDAGGTPVAVVGSGLDVVYPRAHGGLWAEVADRGVVVSEAPLGARPERWRFPARNRIIVALSRAVVVVESGLRGGSMTTVDAAALRDRPVLAVPGPVGDPRSAGTNALLVDGCPPVRDATDVLLSLGLPVHRAPAPQAAGDVEDTVAPTGPDRRVLDALGGHEVGIDAVLARTRDPLPEVLGALARLEANGRVVRNGSGYRRSVP